jgi:hypothetical protein
MMAGARSIATKTSPRKISVIDPRTFFEAANVELSHEAHSCNGGEECSIAIKGT